MTRRARSACGRRTPRCRRWCATWVDDTLGSPVVEAVDVVGGMSPGCATRLRCADGTRAFVKAVGTDLNPDTPTLFRREITALTLLGTDPLWAGLLASYDDGDRVALLLEDVEGQHPDLARRRHDGAVADGDRGARRGAAQPASTTSDVQHHVGSVLMEPGLTDLSAVLHHWLPAFDQVGELPDAPVPAWVRDEALTWQRADGRVRGRAVGHAGALGHPGRQPAAAADRGDRVPRLGRLPASAGRGSTRCSRRLERVDQPWFDRSLAASPALAALGDDAVTTWLVGIGTNLAVRAATAVDVNLPTLADFRRTESARFLGAAARRLGTQVVNLGSITTACGLVGSTQTSISVSGCTRGIAICETRVRYSTW